MCPSAGSATVTAFGTMSSARKLRLLVVAGPGAPAGRTLKNPSAVGLTAVTFMITPVAPAGTTSPVTSRILGSGEVNGPASPSPVRVSRIRSGVIVTTEAGDDPTFAPTRFDVAAPPAPRVTAIVAPTAAQRLLALERPEVVRRGPVLPVAVPCIVPVFVICASHTSALNARSSHRGLIGVRRRRGYVSGMTRLVSGVFILLGVVLIVGTGIGGPRPGSGSLVVGIAAVVVGVVMRLLDTAGRVRGTRGGDREGVREMAGPRTFQGRRVDATFSAADIVAQGVPTTGQLRSASLTGQTAGQVVPNVPADQAGDPIAMLEFDYPGPSGVTLVKEALVRVPSDKLQLLAPGTQLPIRYIADQPEIAAIDWSRL